MSEKHNRLIIGNWKMHGDQRANADLIADITNGLVANIKTDVALCVPFPYLAQAQRLLLESNIDIGAQDISAHENGAYTGDVSASMLADFGCKWVLCGHSERRAHHAETSMQVALKAKQAITYDLNPVVCVGETMAERNDNQVEQIIASQLSPVLALSDNTVMDNLVIAYEPVWAIGTGHTASPEQAQQVHAFIRSELAQYELDHIRIIYGGSVKPENAAALFSQPDINGALVGGASLDAKSFTDIVLATDL